MASVVALGVGIVGVTSYLLGFWDRPTFSTSQLLLDEETSSKNEKNKSNQDWFAIVALCRDKNIGKHVMKLIQGTKQGIESLPNGAQLLREGSMAYLVGQQGDPPVPNSLCIGFFFDDPSQVDQPRWAMGWAIRGGPNDSNESYSLKELQSLVQEYVQPNSGLGLDHDIRVLRLSGETPIFRGNVPWRSYWTPMIAPLLHWKRAFHEFVQTGYTCSSLEGPICMEIYVMNEQRWFTSYIDYIIAYGDNSIIWQDAFPGPKAETAVSE